MDRLVVKLKAIKYKIDIFCYLSFYLPDFGFQAAYLLTLFFWLYAFKTFYLWRNVFIYRNFKSQIRFNNLNLHLLSPLFI